MPDVLMFAKVLRGARLDAGQVQSPKGGVLDDSEAIDALAEALVACVEARVLERQSSHAREAARAEISDTAGVERATLTKAEAAKALGVSDDHLERHILPDLRVIRSGRRVLVPVRELHQWAEKYAAYPLGVPV